MRRRDFLSATAAPLMCVSRRSPSCIVLRLTGGPSHIDTWDIKPDAPTGVRGPWRPIPTNVSGMAISELFPRMARCADRYAIIRSVHHDVTTHEAAEGAMLPPDLATHDRVVTINMYRSVFDETTWDMHGWKPFSPMRVLSRCSGAGVRQGIHLAAGKPAPARHVRKHARGRDGRIRPHAEDQSRWRTRSLAALLFDSDGGRRY